MDESNVYRKCVYNRELEPSLITLDKVYAFLYYQAYRTKKKRPNKEKGRISKKGKSVDRNGYNKVMNHDGVRGILDAIGPQVISYYLCDLRQHIDI